MQKTENSEPITCEDYTKRQERKAIMLVNILAVLAFTAGILAGYIVCAKLAPEAVTDMPPPTETTAPTAEPTPAETPETVSVEAENAKPSVYTMEFKIAERTLDKTLQETMIDMCEKYDLPLALALAVAEQESRFNPDAVSATNDHGIMQINSCNFGWLRKKCIEPLDHHDNIEAGVMMLSEAVKKYGDYHVALMAYNGGDNYADRLLKQGVYSTRYSRETMERFEKWSQYLGGI